MRLSWSMQQALRLLANGDDPFLDCRGRHEHGGRTQAIQGLRRRGLVRGMNLTDAGHEAARKLVTPNACIKPGRNDVALDELLAVARRIGEAK